MAKQNKITPPNARSSSNIKSPNDTKVSTDDLHPVFSLQYIEKSYCLSNCVQEEKAAFADTLHKLSKSEWVELKLAPRHGMGYEIIPQDSIKTSIPKHITKDTNLIAFRFCGKAAMVGYREKQMFYVIWLDREFNLYKHS